MRSKFSKKFDHFFDFIENKCKINENEDLKKYSDDSTDSDDYENDLYNDDNGNKQIEIEAQTKNRKPFEERFWITLLLSVSLITLFLLITDQKYVLDHEILVFKASQTHIWKELNHILFGASKEQEKTNTIKNENQNSPEIETENQDYSTIRAKYDQYSARKEFQLDWNSLTDSLTDSHNNSATESETIELKLQDIVKKIEKEHERIRLLKSILNTMKPPNTQSSSSTSKKDTITNHFSDLKTLKTFLKQESPINEKYQTHSSRQINFINNVNFSYARLIRFYFTRQLESQIKDLESPISLPYQYIQQLKLLNSLQNVLKTLQTSTDKEIDLKRLKILDQITPQILIHQQLLNATSASLKSLYNSFLRNIENIPLYPSMKPDTQNSNKILLKRSSSITENEAYNKIFSRLYKLNG